jgi:hypothetical protein
VLEKAWIYDGELIQNRNKTLRELFHMRPAQYSLSAMQRCHVGEKYVWTEIIHWIWEGIEKNNQDEKINR